MSYSNFKESRTLEQRLGSWFWLILLPGDLRVFSDTTIIRPARHHTRGPHSPGALMP